MILSVGITGQSGFIGTHLYNTLGLYPERYVRIPFGDALFDDPHKLAAWVSQCDVIVHLAALNRHNEARVIYETNLALVKKLIDACETAQSTPHILFASSTQEERDNPYGKSKREGRMLFEQWADKNQGQFTGLIIPNVFGPFGNPYYNSVVATFCHQMASGEQPRIDIDADMRLIYVGELISVMMGVIDEVADKQKNNVVIGEAKVSHTSELKVSNLLTLLAKYKDGYFTKGELPCLDSTFHRNLFNTFLCYINHASFFPYRLKQNTDNRGMFVELIKLNSGGQVSFSTTVPGITRGNHFHTRKAERFAVIKGKARIELRRIGTKKVMTFDLDGSQPSFVDMPIWHTHNITNIGNDELLTVFWINEHYEQGDGDTFFEIV